MLEQLEYNVYYYEFYKERAKNRHARICKLCEQGLSYSAQKQQMFIEQEKAADHLKEAFRIAYFLKNKRWFISGRAKKLIAQVENLVSKKDVF